MNYYHGGNSKFISIFSACQILTFVFGDLEFGADFVSFRKGASKNPVDVEREEEGKS